MFKHILIPTDGSELAQKAMKAGIAFAKTTGARVTGYYAFHEPHFRHTRFEEVDDKIRAELEDRTRQASEKYLSAVGEEAKANGVPYDSLITKAELPSVGIIEAAKQCDCDVIFMASHGRSGIANLMLGSVTQGVLAHSKTPVLVFR